MKRNHVKNHENIGNRKSEAMASTSHRIHGLSGFDGRVRGRGDRRFSAQVCILTIWKGRRPCHPRTCSGNANLSTRSRSALKRLLLSCQVR
ncbi:hypothetical protein CEXT_695201 [Caerostris extrusa]|uniref:Uncharacterized protein n=1 Tax=Caerostris extrusa TaxID=172846 RepID=A0AAV4S6K4_CAEEX|nr:hypothetical protein CEXT_695201 [Caerostris extrusa]